MRFLGLSLQAAHTQRWGWGWGWKKLSVFFPNSVGFPEPEQMDINKFYHISECLSDCYLLTIY